MTGGWAGPVAALLSLVTLALAVIGLVLGHQRDDTIISRDHAEIARLHQKNADVCRTMKKEAAKQGLLWISEPADCESVTP